VLHGIIREAEVRPYYFTSNHNRNRKGKLSFRTLNPYELQPHQEYESSNDRSTLSTELDLSPWIKIDNKRKKIDSTERLLTVKRRICANSGIKPQLNKRNPSIIQKEGVYQDQIDVIDPLRVGKGIAEDKLNRSRVKKGLDLFARYEQLKNQNFETVMFEYPKLYSLRPDAKPITFRK
jgi:hypothetical protein